MDVFLTGHFLVWYGKVCMYGIFGLVSISVLHYLDLGSVLGMYVPWLW